ncbi:AAA family ATPase [Novosphingobium taihuense]|uniref:Pilus assembly protein CpaE n=1 Tax=Novosphingobium taihuense TaxID=260085 RepID=A0A7W7AEP5_9SPHN|nr:pilus assembly protein CpaE [Novosphingobium taihuense]MBB4615654.1 pilus assembly protein CpaE [Novosphingobium taihuense]TWH79586.1 pilus assembly protein CpaE [Novosphingobium taihuense]
MDYSDQPHPGPSAFDTPPVGVFVSERQAGDLLEQADAATRVILMIRSVGNDETIPFEKLGGLAVVVLEVDPSSRRSVNRLVNLVRSNPPYPVIAAISSPEMSLVRTLVREGVTDVLSLPLTVPELTQACLDAVARKAQPATALRLAPLIGVVGSSGGCGATSVATHLASALARSTPEGRRVILGDLDLQFGSVGAYLGADRSGSFTDLIEAEDRLDEELLKALAPEGRNGFAVLAVPDKIPSSDSVSHEAILRVIEQLRTTYEMVVLDFPANWSNWSASVAYSANLLLLVTEPTLPSLRQVKRTSELFDAIGVPRSKVHVVVNKMERKLFKPIDVSDIERTLDRNILAKLPRDNADLARAQDQGVLIHELVRKSAFGTSVAGLATSVIDLLQSGGTR